MTEPVARLYAFAAILAVFFLTWAAVAAHPWSAAPPDPRIAALGAREQRVRRQSVEVSALVDRRWAAYRIALASRTAANARTATVQRRLVSAPAPQVRIVTLPPLTVTRTS